MNKNCARCTKIVYPIEELKCLDKTWHKTCFKCHECGMTLNMKTYKGFNKLPYCEAHIPKAKATAIADTPELKRIAENTKIQSNVMYHADFEKQKGKLTQVADDPETLRMKQNSKIISNVAYHGDLEKKAAMEKQREVAEIADNRDNESEYFSETLAAESLSQYQPQPKHAQNPIVPIQQYMSAPQNSQQQKSLQTVTTTPYSQHVNHSLSQQQQAGIAKSMMANHKPSQQQQQQQQQQQPQPQSAIQQKPIQKSISSQVRVFRALYDYEAQDTDEVSFTEGDLIFEVDSIDAGWMTGRVERTGQTGMLPANYVEPAHI
ncbi:LIM and SH3 domain protein Lasp isoform X2 [Sitodiplosis mosellana]|uniref:LIM and SH3 domain protein Lasp isoform X2 n=1 Tax=Sitodiplosis mosellana TaxID=263140 RepID=UPI002444D333|nr:LIM and SH3 domain protein Lasp isoform X2 [Sitodiplosis mosellana]